MIRNLKRQITYALAATLFMLAPATAEETIRHELKLKKVGLLAVELPSSWGSKPKMTNRDGLINVSFGPMGTRREPVFLVSMDLAVAVDDLSKEQVEGVAKGVLENYRGVALEAEIPIVLVEGESSFGYYFTLTDKEKKPREYQYLTLAVVYTNRMIVTSYFLANDGAPDFGADALHMMRTTRFLPVPKKD
ncbi:MAG: hypothetical protein K0U72_18105 [Gammaproteobacteria bacterium]|nr:hypothetical protein [Gammaproteobacteria bacterium]